MIHTFMFLLLLWERIFPCHTYMLHICYICHKEVCVTTFFLCLVSHSLQNIINVCTKYEKKILCDTPKKHYYYEKSLQFNFKSLYLKKTKVFDSHTKKHEEKSCNKIFNFLPPKPIFFAVLSSKIYLFSPSWWQEKNSVKYAILQNLLTQKFSKLLKHLA